MAVREAERMSCWARVPWGSKSFSPRRGRVGVGVVLEGGVSLGGEERGEGGVGVTGRGWLGSGSLGVRP